MNADQLRDKFLNFFKSKKHKIIESDSLVPCDDPTILFTPAGMNQFKKQFLGQITDFTRAATSQRCLRTDDLEKVGKTSSHHTYFEMLGNFSFGDYFKEEAITWAWEFLTEELKIKKDRLWASVYKDDSQAYIIWRDKIKIPAERIVKLGDKENFWPAEAKAKGPNGPCGPCSEIFFDQGKDVGCKQPNCNPACSCGRFFELWNLVFTQFNRRQAGVLEPLPQKNIDTGMGLERLTAVMQGKENNFETELFQPLIKEIVSSIEYRVSSKELLYAISDHIRAITFAIYDGALPSNEGRGYVVRKLVRKSSLHLRELGFKKPFLYTLVPVLAEIMRLPYPELKARRENIAALILAEEKAFLKTLDSSDSLFKDKFKGLLNNSDPIKAGSIAFQLYDTYGIPWELTLDWLNRQNIKVSRQAFDEELEKQKNRSKSQSAMKGDVFSVRGLLFGLKKTRFCGYKQDITPAKIIKIIKDDREVKKISSGDSAEIILDKTVFYAESGGQVGDTGVLVKAKNIFEVLDTEETDKVIIHIGRVKQGGFKKNGVVSAKIDVGRRLAIARNHTATHILQAALRAVLGPHVKQQGSLVAAQRLRFDFTHFKDVTGDELERIEKIVNQAILNNYPVSTKQMTLQQAKKAGVLALFGEKYEQRVRAVLVAGISKELCGGTHLESSAQIGIFKIISESSVASGVRRIEALTGDSAYQMLKDADKIVGQIASDLALPRQNIVSELQKRLSRIKELEKQLSRHKQDIVKDSLDALIKSAQDINGIKVIAKVVTAMDMDLLRSTIDLLKAKLNNAIILLGSSASSRAVLVMGITADLTQRGFDAAKLIVEPAKIIGGSGGGRLDFAQAGGNKPQGLEKAIQEFQNIIANLK